MQMFATKLPSGWHGICFSHALCTEPGAHWGARPVVSPWVDAVSVIEHLLDAKHYSCLYRAYLVQKAEGERA